jgi:Spy/CpxP family protein refolding chaperone
MFNKRIFSVVLAALLFSALSSVVVAQAHAGQGPMARMARLKTYLALTDKQVADIQVLLKTHQTAAFPIRQDLRARTQELQNALDAAQPNAAAIGQIVIAQHSLRGQLQTLDLKLESDIAAQLTPEQQQKFEQLKSRIGKRARRG